jgi:hypothetical protein
MAAREVLAYRVASRINWKAFTSAHTALLVETALRSGIDAWKSLLNGGISTDQALQVRKVICEVCVVRADSNPPAPAICLWGLISLGLNRCIVLQNRDGR